MRQDKHPPCPVLVQGEVLNRALGLSVAYGGQHCAGPFLLWCTHRWVREGEVMKRNIQILMALLFISTFSMEASATHICKYTKTGVYTGHVIGGIARDQVKIKWSLKVLKKYGPPWQGWLNAKYRGVKCKTIKILTAVPVVRCDASGYPCKPH